MAKIKCTDCGYENEPERVYCHNCGAKLDRSLLPEEPKKPEPKKVRKQVRKLTNPKSGFFVGFWHKLFAALAWGAFVAALIQIARPPKDAPEMPEKGEIVEAPPIALILETAIQKGGGKSIALDQPSINNYLLSSIRSKSAGPLADYVKFDRAYVDTRDGVIEITVQHSIYGYPIYATSFYQLAIDEEKKQLVATNCGGRFGSLPVHPLVMPYLEFPLRKLWDAASREKRVMDQLESVEVRKGAVVVTPRVEPVQ